MPQGWSSGKHESHWQNAEGQALPEGTAQVLITEAGSDVGSDATPHTVRIRAEYTLRRQLPTNLVLDRRHRRPGWAVRQTWTASRAHVTCWSDEAKSS